ncbi:uncharacterized protein LOC106876468 [Octopus bimaculoides]|uniref:uncharacterized protein LOC106876468 n=1 Tax=Octopus bimaculoides TaxID=37653 RepID=UPI0022E51179|nr:uncharacterized protein LOC106876468 [Octopus bimaculoides]
MRRPVVWQCQNHKFECDLTCANNNEFKVFQTGNGSLLWIRQVTEECLTWKFEDANINGGIIHLKLSNQGTIAKRIESNETRTSNTSSIFTMGLVKLGIIFSIVTGLCIYKFKKNRSNNKTSRNNNNRRY